MVKDVIRARRFEVVDSKGNPRMVLTAEEDASNLTLVNGDGKEVARLFVSEKGSPFFILNDQAGKQRMTVEANEGFSAIVLLNDEGQGVVELIDEDGTPNAFSLESCQ